MTTAPKKTASKYTSAMEARISESAPLNQEKSEALAKEFGPGFSARSVTAKAVRMGVAYTRKVAVTKTGGKIENKEALCAEIASIVSGNLDGLDKAPKPALQALRDYLAA